MLHQDRAGRQPGAEVSILIQPEVWMLQIRIFRENQFRPCFNPHPTRRLDATEAAMDGPALALPVSILIQPEGWMLPAWAAEMPPATFGFNPHPTRRLDA